MQYRLISYGLPRRIHSLTSLVFRCWFFFSMSKVIVYQQFLESFLLLMNYPSVGHHHVRLNLSVMFDELITLYRFLELYRRRLKEKAATDSPCLPEVTHNCFHMNPFIFQSGNRYWFHFVLYSDHRCALSFPLISA